MLILILYLEIFSNLHVSYQKTIAEFSYIIAQIPQLLTLLNHLSISCRPDDPLPIIFHYFIQCRVLKFKNSFLTSFM